ncbi:MAG: alpha/beta hydrolase [Steroidobacteraceae bacterium]
MINSALFSRREALRLAGCAAALCSPRSWANGRAVDESGYVPIGGIEQWVQIRGDSRDNPVLLWLNGGPGYSTIPYAPAYRSWERNFTLVMWDQRGEGKTFERSGRSVAPRMTIKRMAEDGIELAEYLCRHLHGKKIILLGHSWGSILGIHMIKLRPDLFSAYVGTGQIVDLEQDAQVAYPLLLARAKRLHNTLATRQLEAVGPPPYPDTPKKWVWIRWANELDPTPRGLWAALRGGKTEPAYIEEGANFSQSLMWSSIMQDDLPKLGVDFKVPIFFIQGAQDDLAVTALARKYFERIHAPLKKFIVLPQVGHLAIFAARKAFLAQLLKWVRPLAIAAS